MKINNTDLIECVDQKISNVRTKSLDLSFNELLDMYKDGELIISPEYQRLFRWSEDQQSRFIESLILELPIPPIFVIEKEQNIYELIDGLQRISTYLHFRGILKDENGKPAVLKLNGCDIVKELNRLTYELLPQALKIKLKRNFVRVEVIKKESDLSLRYYMFKRLNTGGSSLSPQEIRNCTVRLLGDLGDKFVNSIIEMNKYPAFRECIKPLMKYDIEKKQDEELVLRFFAFKNNLEKYHEKNIFLTEYMEGVSEGKIQFDYEHEKTIFRKTFDLLSSIMGKDIFTNLQGQFLSFHYEAFSLGVQKFLDKITISDQAQIVKIKERLKELKQSDNFKEASKRIASKQSLSYFKKKIESVEKTIESVL